MQSALVTSSLPNRLSRPLPSQAKAPEPKEPVDSFGGGARRWLEGLLVPSNFPRSVSKDYSITRKWQVARDLAGSVSWGYAAAMAISAATIPGIAAVGLSLFSYGLIKDRLSQATGFLSSTCTPLAASNPRAWMLAGDMLDSAGVAVLSGAALCPPAFVPVSIAVGAVQTFANTMRGAASADIGPRQAVADNLGELNAKNSNQSLIASNAGLAIGGALFAATSGLLGAAALPIIGAVTAAVGVYCTARMLANLDMHPINENAVRVIVDDPNAAPERENVWGALKEIATKDRIELGQDPALLQRDPVRLAELQTLYAGRNYLLESVGGKPYIVLTSECKGEDRFQAVFQAVQMEKLAASPEYTAVVKEKGQDQADFWLVAQSLERTPSDVKPMLDKLEKAGWSADMLRFRDTGVRSAQEK